jgi:hypothetical protein
MRRRWIVAAAGLLAALLAVSIAPATAKKKNPKVRNPGPLTLATQTSTVGALDHRARLTVGCPGRLEPYGGGLLVNPPPGPDGEGIYPNSYERLGKQRGFHITATLIDPGGGGTTPREATLQVMCGKKIGKISDPHKVVTFERGEGPKPIVAKCPGGKSSLIGGGYQRSNGVSNSGVVTTGSHRISRKAWKVVAHSLGGFTGEAVSIGYCVQSGKSLITEVAGSVTIPTGQAATATTIPCPPDRQLAYGGFSTPPEGGIRFMGAGFTAGATWSATGFNSGPPATLTAYGYCLKV